MTSRSFSMVMVMKGSSVEIPEVSICFLGSGSFDISNYVGRCMAKMMARQMRPRETEWLNIFP